MDEIEMSLIRCFEALFPELSPEQIVQAEPATVARWDSVATVTLFAMVEEEFGINVEAAAGDNVMSFSGLHRFLSDAKFVKKVSD